MSSRIVPLTALSVMLLVIFWAVVATAQQPGIAQQPGLGQPQQLTQEQYDEQQRQLAQQQQQLVQQQQLQPIGQLPPGVQPISGQPIGQQPLAGPPPEAQPLPQAPFTLSPQEEAVLDRLLTDWQAKSGEVKTFESTFTRWDYDGVFGDPNKAKRVVKGLLRYSAPDKGYYALDDESEKWICTGDSVFEFRKDLKQMREHPLPKAMQGQAIADGPMPFVFGVQAAKMKARYWMRITTPQANQATQVWLEVYPRHAKDSANFQKIDVILSFAHDGTNVTKLEPYALNLHKPNGKDRDVYQFTNMTVNGALNNIADFFKGFVRPTTPFGWQHQVMPAEDAPPQQGPPTPQAFGPGGAPQGQSANSATNVQPGVDVGSALPTGAVR